MTVGRRIAIDLRPLALGSPGGVGLAVSQLLFELNARGVDFVGVSHLPIPRERVPETVHVMVARHSGGRIRWESRTLPRLLRHIHPPPDLYHATWNHGIPPGLSFPSVLTVHDLIPWLRPREVPWPRPAAIHRWFYRRALRRSAREAAAITTVSEASRRDIRAVLPDLAERIEVVPNALPRWFRPLGEAAKMKARARWNEGRPYWLYLGGFDPRKGVGLLLDAMAAAFPDPGRAPDLLLAGSMNPLAGQWDRRARALGLHARFPGFVPDPDLPALFAGATLFLYPSRYEGFGIPLLFAMASGVPTLASDAGAIPEVLGDAGITFPAGDLGALRDLLRRAAADPTWLLPVAARGPERALRYRPEVTAERMLQVYDRAASRRGGST